MEKSPSIKSPKWWFDGRKWNKLKNKFSQMVVKDGDLLYFFLHPQQNQLQEIQYHHGGFGYLKILPLSQFFEEFPYIGRTRFDTEVSWL